MRKSRQIARGNQISLKIDLLFIWGNGASSKTRPILRGNGAGPNYKWFNSPRHRCRCLLRSPHERYRARIKKYAGQSFSIPFHTMRLAVGPPFSSCSFRQTSLSPRSMLGQFIVYSIFLYALKIICIKWFALLLFLPFFLSSFLSSSSRGWISDPRSGESALFLTIPIRYDIQGTIARKRLGLVRPDKFSGQLVACHWE